MKREVLKGTIFLLLFCCTLLCTTVGIGRAADELYLTGVVKNIDYARKTVVVQVLSQTCRGQRKFSTDDPEALTLFIDQKINFTIDSSICVDNEVYKMFLAGRK